MLLCCSASMENSYSIFIQVVCRRHCWRVHLCDAFIIEFNSNNFVVNVSLQSLVKYYSVFRSTIINSYFVCTVVKTFIPLCYDICRGWSPYAVSFGLTNPPLYKIWKISTIPWQMNKLNWINISSPLYKIWKIRTIPWQMHKLNWINIRSQVLYKIFLTRFKMKLIVM